MSRLATIVVVLLLGGTAAAFVYTQGLKQTKSPIVSTRVVKPFSPVCNCPTRAARIRFGLRKPDHVSISILDSGGHVVRTLFTSKAIKSGFHGFSWDGRTDDGTLAKDGVYKARVDLDDADRTITLPNKITLDTVPPRVTGARARLSKDLLTVVYSVSEPAHGLLFVDGRRVVKRNSSKLRSTMQVPLTYLRQRGLAGQIAVGAEDLAGNLARLRVLNTRVKAGG
ncbi:MAG TPA: FlgD immunoglobulin-like domain containing protein [Gaiellaceae bacterium]|nr:FlgD immunoglobulin-like domain containing protein [Gaiellaceae bacterium]